MNDTSPAAARMLEEALLSLPGEERLKMGCSMFDDAKALALAGLRAKNPDMTRVETREALFRRLYGSDFSPEKVDKIAAAIA